MITPNKVTKTWQVHDAYEGYSVRDFLLEAGEFSRQIWKKVRMEGELEVNGQPQETWKPLKSGDELKVFFPDEERGAIDPVEGPLSIIYEDEDVLVLDKPSGLAVVPPIDQTEPSLASYILHHYYQNGHPCTVHIVTRLDRHTSGLMLVAKHAYSHMLLTKGLDRVERRYQAIIHGSPDKKEGMIDEPIGRAEESIIRRTVSTGGKPSKTLYEVEKEGDEFSRIRLRLFTGRTHQIRVHMAHLGFPLAGDTLYGGEKAEELDGQALHCYSLRFLHPWKKKKMTFVSEPPKTWREFDGR